MVEELAASARWHVPTDQFDVQAEKRDQLVEDHLPVDSSSLAVILHQTLYASCNLAGHTHPLDEPALAGR